MNFPNRKSNRLSCYNYSQDGYYHITLCTMKKNCLLGQVLPGDIFTPPTVKLSPYGLVVENHILGIPIAYRDVLVDKYCIMPNHVHLLLRIQSNNIPESTRQNEKIPFLVSSLKRLTNKETGNSLWQRGYYDHIIRSEQDYLAIWQYIDDNPAKWVYDDYYISG